MDLPNVTALSLLKVGDIFELAQLISPPNEPGVHTVRWQVDSIGDTLCGIVMESAASVPENVRFITQPLMVASQTSVLHLSDWNPGNSSSQR